jgi:hypothetical protein
MVWSGSSHHMARPYREGAVAKRISDVMIARQNALAPPETAGGPNG